MLPPRPLLALCVLLVGLLSWSVAARPPPTVAIEDAARWEGQTVRVEGWASDSRKEDDGLRLVLTDAGRALQVRSASDVHPGIGDRVEATGRLSRWQGMLRLDADALRVLGGPKPVQTSWHDLAESPADWRGTPIRLMGRIHDGLLSGDGASVALGDGPWPSSGVVAATGLLRYDTGCLCHRFDAREVRPWTP